jgi:hypothetical protein
MRFMMIMFPSGYENAKPSTVPDLKEIQRATAESRRAARARRSNPALDGRACHFQKRKVESHRRTV